MPNEKDPKKDGQGAASGAGDSPRMIHIGDAQDAPTIALCPQVTADAADEFQAKLDAEVKARKDAEAKADALAKDFERLQGKADGANDKVVALERQIAELKTVSDAADGRFDERLDMVETARQVIPGYAHRGKSIAEMRKDVILAVVPDAKLDGKSEDYIAARFDAVLEQLSQPLGGNDLRGRRDDAEDPKPEKRRNLHRDGKKSA